MLAYGSKINYFVAQASNNYRLIQGGALRGLNC